MFSILKWANTSQKSLFLLDVYIQVFFKGFQWRWQSEEQMVWLHLTRREGKLNVSRGKSEDSGADYSCRLIMGLKHQQTMQVIAHGRALSPCMCVLECVCLCMHVRERERVFVCVCCGFFFYLLPLCITSSESKGKDKLWISYLNQTSTNQFGTDVVNEWFLHLQSHVQHNCVHDYVLFCFCVFSVFS